MAACDAVVASACIDIDPFCCGCSVKGVVLVRKVKSFDLGEVYTVRSRVRRASLCTGQGDINGLRQAGEIQYVIVDSTLATHDRI